MNLMLNIAGINDDKKNSSKIKYVKNPGLNSEVCLGFLSTSRILLENSFSIIKVVSK